MRANIIREVELKRVLDKADKVQRVMVLLSHRAGLRACEISRLDWRMVLDADGSIAEHIDLPAIASKGRTGQGRIPIAPDLRKALTCLAALYRFPRRGNVVQGPRKPLSAHAVAQRLNRLYAKAELDASSHSGRRTYATRLDLAGLSAFQVQRAMRHRNISTTKLYVCDASSDAKLSDAIKALAS